MLNRKGLLLVVSGPSGAGKGTICKALLNKNDQINYQYQLQLENQEMEKFMVLTISS